MLKKLYVANNILCMVFYFLLEKTLSSTVHPTSITATQSSLIVLKKSQKASTYLSSQLKKQTTKNKKKEKEKTRK